MPSKPVHKHWLQIRKWGIRVLKVASVMWLVAHMTLTVLFVMPLNPLKNELRPILKATIGTYFYQNWSLFAPNPVSNNHALLIRPMTAEEADIAEVKGLPETGWYDVSSPLWKRFQHNRLSAYDRLSRTHSNAVRRYLNGGVELSPLRQACFKGNTEACQVFEEQVKAARGRAKTLLVRVASALSNDLCAGQSSPCTYVALRIRETASVPWSERYTADPVTRDLEVGIFPIDKTVTPLNLFAAHDR